MLGWFQIWKDSHTDTQFFRRASLFSGGFFTFYLLSIYLILSLFSTAIFATRSLPQWGADSEELWWDLQKNWPENVSVQLENNRLDINGADELILPIPQHLANRYNVPSNVLVASENLKIASQSATPAAIIATRETLNIWNPDGSYRSEPWELFDFGNGSLEKSSFTEFEPQFREAQEMLQWTSLLVFFFLNWIGVLFVRAVGLIFYSWIGQSLLRLFGSKVTFTRSYKIGLFLLPIAEEILLAARLLYPNSGFLSYWLVWFVLLAAIGLTNRKALGNAG
jgi:hypothetical protein